MTTTVPRCESTWIQTYTGRQFWPLNPNPLDIDIRDIAHALGNMARYNGHTSEFYSVAQHSVLVSRIVPEWLALPALLHDASEAYVADITSPVKPHLAGYREIEDRIMDAVATAFDYVLDDDGHRVIKHADLRALVTERRDLFHSPREWRLVSNLKPLNARIEPMAPSAARHAFTMRFRELTYSHLNLREDA